MNTDFFLENTRVFSSQWMAFLIIRIINKWSHGLRRKGSIVFWLQYVSLSRKRHLNACCKLPMQRCVTNQLEYLCAYLPVTQSDLDRRSPGQFVRGLKKFSDGMIFVTDSIINTSSFNGIRTLKNNIKIWKENIRRDTFVLSFS